MKNNFSTERKWNNRWTTLFRYIQSFLLSFSIVALCLSQSIYSIKNNNEVSKVKQVRWVMDCRSSFTSMFWKYDFLNSKFVKVIHLSQNIKYISCKTHMKIKIISFKNSFQWEGLLQKVKFNHICQFPLLIICVFIFIRV